jgi:hypothetical protein
MPSTDIIQGGHAFPRRTAIQRRTVVPTVAFEAQRTKAILKNCKAHNVSISAALFAICDIAWAKLNSDKPDLPLYVAISGHSTLVSDIVCMT